MVDMGSVRGVGLAWDRGRVLPSSPVTACHRHINKGEPSGGPGLDIHGQRRMMSVATAARQAKR
jgi:hypothetical protein